MQDRLLASMAVFHLEPRDGKGRPRPRTAGDQETGLGPGFWDKGGLGAELRAA